MFDLNWINSFLVPLVVIIGSFTALFLFIMLIFETLLFYKKRLKQLKGVETPRPAPYPVQPEGVASTEQKLEGNTNEGYSVKGGLRSKILRLRPKLPGLKVPGMSLFSKGVKEREKERLPEKIEPPQAPEFPKDSPGEGPSEEKTEPPSEQIEKAEVEPKPAQESQEPAKSVESVNSTPESEKSEDRDVQEEKSKDSGENLPKLKMISSLDEARSLIESKISAKLSEEKKVQKDTDNKDTDDVAELLGITSSPPEKKAPPNVLETSPNTNEVNESNSDFLKSISEKAPDLDESKKEENKKTGDFQNNYDEELTAAELLRSDSGEEAILVLSHQLTELKTSLEQLEKKLKSLKETR